MNGKKLLELQQSRRACPFYNKRVVTCSLFAAEALTGLFLRIVTVSQSDIVKMIDPNTIDQSKQNSNVVNDEFREHCAVVLGEIG